MVFLASGVLSNPVRRRAVIAGLVGLVGVALLVLKPGAAPDPVGIAAALARAASMALGTVLSRKWQPPVSLLAFTAWHLTAGGVLLFPIAIWLGATFPVPEAGNLLAMAWLGLVGAALT